MMETMESSKPKSELFDPLRKKWVERTPEEVIRQSLIKDMVERLAYPAPMVAVERELSTLPHLAYENSKNIPKRRADIIVFSKKIHPDHEFFPLLLIECKAVPLNEKFVGQVIGYNAFVKAPFICLANGMHILTGYFDQSQQGYRFESGLPEYNQLLGKMETCLK